MPSFLPISLAGATLNERHRQFNEKIREAVQHNVPFDTIRDGKEKTPLDALFKIEYAVAIRYLPYVLKTLENQDLLLVSKSLCNWLLEKDFENVINPKYLEESLYPKMKTTAVNKMKHWIAQNLRDATRCDEFYEFYTKKEFDLAIKFFYNCSEEYILKKVSNLLEKLTPHMLKVLCEKCPKVSEIYFDSLGKDNKVTKVYLDNHHDYFKVLKYILKLSPNVVLDVYEKYFVDGLYKRFSAESTRYIMTEHKDRFTKKPELYTVWFLDIKTLAKCLPEDEIKDLMYKLARAEYVSKWFSFKNTEPLIKRLKLDEQKSLKYEIFVDKKMDNKVKDWPYPVPALPEVSKYYESKIFEDKDDYSDSYDTFSEEFCDAGFMGNEENLRCMTYRDGICPSRFETTLEKLFEQYRFVSFEKTLADLRRKMTVDNVKNRQSMMLVLVSKTGGRPESVDELMKLLLERHENEPVHIRASVIRSLVRRSCMWRLPQAQWEMCLKFARNLGLDGKPAEAACTEGLHAVLLRNILNNHVCDPLIWEAYLDNFSSFKEYSLTASERLLVTKHLPLLLVEDTKTHPNRTFQCLDYLLTTLKEYKISADKCEGAIKAFKQFAATDAEKAECLITSLFHARVSRKDMFKENFAVIQTDMSYLNALKHDIDVLKTGEKFEVLLELGDLNHQRFLRALSLWFGEKDGLADVYFALLQNHADLVTKNKQLPRSLALLARDSILTIIKAFEGSDDEKQKLCAALKANAHLSRPLIGVDDIELESFGSKAIANQLLTCSSVKANELLERLLSEPRTQRLALVISMRIGKEYDTLSAIVKTTPISAIKTVLKHQKAIRKDLDPRVWDIVIETLAHVKLTESKDKEFLYTAANYTAIIPENRKAEYCVAAFKAFSNLQKEPPSNLMTLIAKNLENVDETFVIKMSEDFVDNKLSDTKSEVKRYERIANNTRIYISILARFLMLSKSENSLEKRLVVGKKFFDRLQEFWAKKTDKPADSETESDLNQYLDTFLQSLKYTNVFMNNENTYYMQVFEHVATWMQNFLPREQYFDKYTSLHLTMLYSKAIKQGIKNNPEIFKDLSNKLKEAVEIVGIIFGKYIANEVCLLKEKYFKSVIHLYKNELVDYFDNCFHYDDVLKMFIGYIVMGILEGQPESHTIVEYMYNEKKYMIHETFHERILKKLKESQIMEIKFFMNLKMYSQECSDPFSDINWETMENC